MLNLGAMEDGDRTQAICDVFKWIREQGGRLPFEAYRARISTFPTVHHECIEFTQTADGEQLVLLDRRPDDDPDYAGMYGTQGFTVMRGMTLEQMLRKHCDEESGAPISAGAFVFCGLGVSPLTGRDHAYVPIFGRILKDMNLASRSQYTSRWVPIDQLDKYKIVPSNLAYLNMAIGVMFYGMKPRYAEFLGDV